MLHNTDDCCIFGMPTKKVWPYGLILTVWLCCSSLPIKAQQPITNPVEVMALRTIKKSLIDINKNLSNWNRGDPCTSNWTGVLCFNTTLDDGYLHVRELQLLSMNLSGSLSPELGRLSYLKILDFMWNSIGGTIPKEIGNITTLELLLLNGNQLTGPLPDELGYLPNLDRIQIDQNHISGPIPKSFANLNKTKHFHMNNNSISGQIPPELHILPSLVHFLLDNNNLSGYLPPEFSELPQLLILQLDNNHFDGDTIPISYGNMTKLLKFNLSNNNLTGPVPANLSGLPHLQKLLLANNSLNGTVPSTIWQSSTFNGTESLIVDFQNNELTNISGTVDLPLNVTVWLQGNPICSNSNLVQFCGPRNGGEETTQSSTNSTDACPIAACPPPFEYSTMSPVSCFCAAPLLFGYRLKSPGFSDFFPYERQFEEYLTSGLELNLFQLDIDSFRWEEGPRLRMFLKLFPVYDFNGSSSHIFNGSEVRRIVSMFTGWNIPDSEIFGPYELLNFTLLAPYQDVFVISPSSGISKGALAGIVVGAIAGAVTLSAIVSILILRVCLKDRRAVSKRRHASKASIKIDGVKSFTYGEMAAATKFFDSSSQVGQGGYGKVYKGTLADGTAVAIKRAQEGSLQGEKEFLTEIELLSRVHHRSLVSLVGYCDEEGEQMLVYEFMPNGTLRDNLSAKSRETLSFAMRLRIALGSAKGILYLHTEADPPIFHRDIKASNILLDYKFNAKVADFGLSRLAPVAGIEGTVPAHVSTVVKGTPGYLDPEYFLTHKLTDKSDVYSMGVVFLELLTGMQPISHGKNIVREVNIAYQTGMVFSVIDGRMGSYPSECVEKFMTLALRCCGEETDTRPSMADVVRELENIWLMMPESDTRTTESLNTDSGVISTSPSSSSKVKNPYISSDVSGSDLVSGVIPTIAPR
ncbi:probable LRR receptor-like serine/threonine-protein kinase At1g06840 isoform X2 [Tripterygium wilfordii]|uniref:probable LRR receptor-like serine/threonine-protein kinase At1g06840 isoform X2 n=1 Tax=Tripterygium wilfordii TaxID=458696 RepID=UPI0018F81B7C|nr:probable LRR receptor-like serine/threonine-protein kinase At1g06840 isoform X2 [Tripterygium wilfordii]